MILRPRARPQSVLQAFARPSQAQSTFRFQQRRSEHTVPDLGSNNEKGIRFEEQGVPGFLTPKTYRQTWQQYQKALCDEVNSTTEGLKYANMKPHALHVTLSHNPEHAALYNAAAMLHFNHFWWESLTSEKRPIPDKLKKNIEESFHSVEDLRVEMLQHADAMFGNGFVWLVKETSSIQGLGSNPMMRILCTYNAGSPYRAAHQRRQSHDMATSDPMTARLSATGDRLTQAQGKAGAFGPHSGAQSTHHPNSLNCQPILCLNTWQHMYMLDYGILGKRAYLAAWWERIDWDVVSQRYEMGASSASSLL